MQQNQIQGKQDVQQGFYGNQHNIQNNNMASINYNQEYINNSFDNFDDYSDDDDDLIDI